jgi:ADP-ribose pyrophosphatase YjhB (NUDIX family)
MMRILLGIWKVLAAIPGMQVFLLRRINAHFIIGASALVLDEEGRVLLFHHTYRRRYAWGLPGGWLKRGEKPECALEREMREESCLSIEVVAPLAMETTRRGGIVEIIYLAIMKGGEFHPSDEVDDFAWSADETPFTVKPLQVRAIAGARKMKAVNKLPVRLND